MVDQSAWKLLSELVHLPHELPQITNPELRDRAAAFGTGLILSAKLTPQDSNVLLLLNDGIGTLLILPGVRPPCVSACGLGVRVVFDASLSSAYGGTSPDFAASPIYNGPDVTQSSSSPIWHWPRTLSRRL